MRKGSGNLRLGSLFWLVPRLKIVASKSWHHPNFLMFNFVRGKSEQGY